MKVTRLSEKTKQKNTDRNIGIEWTRYTYNTHNELAEEVLLIPEFNRQLQPTGIVLICYKLCRLKVPYLQDSNATYTFHMENILMTAVPCVHKSNLLVFAFSYPVTFSSPLVNTVRDLAEVFVVLDTERIAMEKVLIRKLLYKALGLSMTFRTISCFI